MKRNQLFIFITFILSGCTASAPIQAPAVTPDVRIEQPANPYEKVPGDPLGVRIYTLENGLKVYLSRNEEEPSIETRIAIKAGAKDDPADATGLAHYLEHIMFKGTSTFGTLDWEAEKVYLDSLETMFEHYRTLIDPEERKAWYAEIDRVSLEAARYAIPNEYDKITSNIGAAGTNAYTSHDETVYINRIPANQLENWMALEANRFSEIVPRLFHTELEAVYEEKNRMDDRSLAFQKLMEGMFEAHPYGTQTPIGTADHLKNPSITEIKAYFDHYYVPNNAAVILSGDLDYDQALRMVEEYFGPWKPNQELKHPQFAPEPSMVKPVAKEVYGPSSEYVMFGYRLPARNSEEYLKARMTDLILSSQVGVLNLNLNQKQRVQGAGSQLSPMKDYTMHLFSGAPRQDQTLDEVRELILEQLELVKRGEFEDWLMGALTADLKKSEMARMNSNGYRAAMMLDGFTKGLTRRQQLGEMDYMERLTKEDIMEFAQTHYGSNHVTIYKLRGELNAPQVEKPGISKIELNKETNSVFHERLLQNEVAPIEPVFLDYGEEITRTELGGNSELLYVENELNDLFALTFEIGKGSNGDPGWALALSYLDYLGPGAMDAERFKQELFRLGCDFRVSAAGERTYLTVSGLNEHMEQALTLAMELLADPAPDPHALQELTSRILKSRSDNKQSESAIGSRLSEYVMYGPPHSQMKDFLSESELTAVSPDDLIGQIQTLPKLEHHVRYYGPRQAGDIALLLRETFDYNTLQPAGEQPEYELREVEEPAVYWVDFDKIQADITFYFKGRPFDKGRMTAAGLYNAYFGSGMSSVVFQELREAQGLAYSVSAGYHTAARPGRSDYFMATIGTQADKLPDALPALQELVQEMPESSIGFETARQSLIRNTQTRRITGPAKISSYRNALEMGIDYDIREKVYLELHEMSIEDIRDFHREYIRDQPLVVLVVGSRDRIDFGALDAFGPVRELTLEEIFGY